MATKRHEKEGKPSVADALEAGPPDLTALQAIGRTMQWTRRTKDAMFDALWQFRDEALRKRGVFIQLVEAEGKRHECYRRRKGREYPALKLSEEARDALASWRKRPNPFGERSDDLLVNHDLTASEPCLFALETEGGFTWEAAKKVILSADS